MWVEFFDGIAPTSNYYIFDRNYWIVKQRQSINMCKILEYNII